MDQIIEPTLTFKDIVLERQKNVEIRDLAEDARKFLDEEIKVQLSSRHLDGDVVDNFAVTITKKTTYTPSLEWAKDHGAIKEVVDMDIVKKLAKKGVVIPGEKKITEYVMVRPIEGVE